MGVDSSPRGRRGPRAAAGSRALPHLIVAVLALVSIVVCVFAVQTLSLFVSPMLFLAAVFLEAVFIVVFVYALARAATKPSLLLRSLAASAWEGLEENPSIVRFRRSRVPAVRWLRGRFRPDTPTGFRLTVTIVVTAIPLWNLAALSIEIASGGASAVVDRSLPNLMPVVRTSGETTLFAAGTMVGSPLGLAVVTVVTAVLLWVGRDRFLALVTVALAVGQAVLCLLVKLVAHRSRPDAALALLHAPLGGYPSAEVTGTVVVYGFVGYLVVRAFRSASVRLLTVGVYVLLVLVVGLSRVYFGAVYATDIWAGVLLGAGVLAAAIGTLEIATRFPVIRATLQSIRPSRVILAAPVIGVLVAVLGAPVLVMPRPYAMSQGTSALPSLTATSLKRLPLYSQNLTGERTEPVSLVFVGTEQQLVSAFRRAGWQRADPSNAADTLRAFAVGFQGGQYPTAPVTPSFIATEPETVAFQKATAANTLRRRHHVRIWRTAFTAPDGRQIWEATASYDDGIELAPSSKLPTHHVAPDIDAERAYITASLGDGGQLVLLTHPQMGMNSGGDGFFTDGKAELILLP